jgi:hypothetical protein
MGSTKRCPLFSSHGANAVLKFVAKSITSIQLTTGRHVAGIRPSPNFHQHLAPCTWHLLICNLQVNAGSPSAWGYNSAVSALMLVHLVWQLLTHGDSTVMDDINQHVFSPATL